MIGISIMFMMMIVIAMFFLKYRYLTWPGNKNLLNKLFKSWKCLYLCKLGGVKPNQDVSILCN